jgi:membrane-associated phospholipid phosphatase
MQLAPHRDRETADQRADRSADVHAAIAVTGGLGVLATGMVVVRDGAVPGIERSLFRAINDLPGWLYPVIWPFQQMGVLAIGPAVAIVALVLRRHRLAGAAVLATVLKLVTERLVKMVVSRRRPARSIGDDVELRGDVSTVGESFVSGHAVLIASLATLVTPYLPGRWKFVPWALVAGVLFGRVYVGAHNPLDVVCGAGLGVAIGGALILVLRIHPRATADPRAQRSAISAEVGP